MSQQNGISANAAPEAETESKGALVYLKKLWMYRKYLVIEPFFFFYLMASVFNAVAMQNFPLDKVKTTQWKKYAMKGRKKCSIISIF